MLSYRELFLIGIDFQSYLALGSKAEIDAVNQVDSLLDARLFKTTLARLKRINDVIHVLVAGEVWCPDCQLNITVLNYLSSLQPKFRFSIISKECAEANLLLKSFGLQHVKMPLFMILNSKFKLVELFIERPKILHLSNVFEKEKRHILVANI